MQTMQKQERLPIIFNSNNVKIINIIIQSNRQNLQINLFYMRCYVQS